MTRPTVIVSLPIEEVDADVSELREAGFPVTPIAGREDLETILTSGIEVAVAIIDAESDVEEAINLRAALGTGPDAVPAMLVVGVCGRHILAQKNERCRQDRCCSRQASRCRHDLCLLLISLN